MEMVKEFAKQGGMHASQRKQLYEKKYIGLLYIGWDLMFKEWTEGQRVNRSKMQHFLVLKVPKKYTPRKYGKLEYSFQLGVPIGNMEASGTLNETIHYPLHTEKKQIKQCCQFL